MAPRTAPRTMIIWSIAGRFEICGWCYGRICPGDRYTRRGGTITCETCELTTRKAENR